MMQISTKSEYGLRCLLALARVSGKQSLSLSDIIARERLPKPYAQQILVRLRRAGLVRSIRGTQGGFALAKPASEISVGAIVRTLEGIPFENTCGHFNSRTDCGRLGDCSIRPVWNMIGQRLWDALDKILLSDLLQNEKEVTFKLEVELPVLPLPTLHRP